ncbi:MAG TPA: heavy-metal-associated domain-containing protein, partial [Candidatus Binatia bacterium]|nr:heavy-metal-associated domain-containing protein [Candidatus Binatia bacterium]
QLFLLGGVSVKTKTFETPSLYADHHVTEVRRILMEADGVEEVYASSAFQVVEVTYDEKKINDLEIAVKLDEAGYLGEWTVPVETGVAAAQAADEQKPYFRHTTTYETTKQTVSFAQKVNYRGRPLWYCPGMGPVRLEEESHHA